MSVFSRNNLHISGSGTMPLIFSHGLGCDQNIWRFVAPAFEDEYQVILFDHVGAGKSDLQAYNPLKYNSLEGYADDVLEICAELKLNEVTFVGHSVSAMIGVLAAIKDPARFARLILVSPSPRYVNEGDYVGGFESKDMEELLEFLDSNYAGWASRMAPAMMGAPEQPELSEELKDSFCRMQPHIARQFARVTFLSDNREDLPKVITPALILQCSDDAIAPATVGQYVQRRITHGELALLQASGHCPHLSAPEQVITAIKAYLQSPLP